MQGAMYALGAIPTFPERFPYKEYIYIVDLDIDGNLFYEAEILLLLRHLTV